MYITVYSTLRYDCPYFPHAFLCTETSAQVLMLSLTFPRLRLHRRPLRCDCLCYHSKLYMSQSTLVQFSTFLPLPSCISIYSVIKYEPLLKKDRNNLELQVSLPTGNLKKKKQTDFLHSINFRYQSVYLPSTIKAKWETKMQENNDINSTLETF